MAVCFTGLSPVVCGDVGPDGNVGETDYTRVVLNHTHNVVVKTMQLKFLREGPQNISFQLRPESNKPGGEWHCSDEDSAINDTVVYTVNVLVSHFPQLLFDVLETGRTRGTLSERHHLPSKANLLPNGCQQSFR